MCGIAGIIKKNGPYPERERDIHLMRNAIQHRGPDGDGAYRQDLAFYMNLRLAIVDRAGGAQPIYSSDGRVGIVYNGEVYNYRELKAELEDHGVEFLTNSDTEVILRAYELYGVDSFVKLNGMFAFAIWDERENASYLVRDHLGIKPLYLYEDQSQFIFCSETKGIRSIPNVDLELDPEGVQDYLIYRYIQAPLTCFKKIKRVEAGTYVRFKNAVATTFRYWEPEYSDTALKITPDEAKEEFAKLLRNAVSSQLMGEVPIGVLLSGGLDSSAISYCVHELGANLTTFNIGFPEVNEFQYSRSVAQLHGLQSVEVETSVDELISRFEAVLRAIDEPLADPACFPLYRLCEELRKKVTVVLSGEGSDEMLAGYPQYVQTINSNSSFFKRFETFLDRSWYFSQGANILRDQHLPPRYLRHLKYFESKPLLNGMLNYDIKTWLPEDLMMKADKIMMAHSLEGRFPFLDRHVFDFVAKLPLQFKLHPDGTTKWLLRQVMEEHLPSDVMTRPKMGFSVPIDMFLEKLKPRILDTINSRALQQLYEIVDEKKLRTQIELYYQGSGESGLRAWTLAMLCCWLSQAFDISN